MNRKLLKRSILVIMLLLAVPLYSWAGEPMDRIKTAADRLISILSDNSLRPQDMKIKRNKMIMEVVDRVFSWEEFSRRALATNWNNRTPEEREEFVSLLRQLIVNSYIDYAIRYSGERLIFLDDNVEGNFGTVTGEVVTAKGVHIPVEFRMLKKKESWWVYDINVEGLSFVGYYRNQINSVITRSSYEELIKGLREKVNAGSSAKGH